MVEILCKLTNWVLINSHLYTTAYYISFLCYLHCDDVIIMDMQAVSYFYILINFNSTS